MTNKEAAEILKLYKQRLDESCSNLLDRDKEAFELAIKSLEGRLTGEWIENERYKRKGKKFFDCSVCHYGENGDVMVEVPKIPNFCPNCGADMRGEKK